MGITRREVPVAALLTGLVIVELPDALARIAQIPLLGAYAANLIQWAVNVIPVAGLGGILLFGSAVYLLAFRVADIDSTLTFLKPIRVFG